MSKINIIGRGNVATHLEKAFRGKAMVNAVTPRTLETLDVEADFTLICVSDSAIKEVAEKLPELKGIVAHTSGTTPINVFSGLENISGSYGVFYPMQTFSKDSPLDYSRIPFFIEGTDEATERSLCELAGIISNNVETANSDKRKALHVAAVFSCNFVNHLFALAEGYMSEHSLSFSTMLPLIEETVGKLHNLSPREAQTGPAVRKDRMIIDSHLNALNNYPEMKEIYKTITDSIINTYGNERN